MKTRSDEERDVSLVEVERSDLAYIRRSLDDAIAELEAAVSDGLVKESVLSALDDSYTILTEYLS